MHTWKYWEHKLAYVENEIDIQTTHLFYMKEWWKIELPVQILSQTLVRLAQEKWSRVENHNSPLPKIKFKKRCLCKEMFHILSIICKWNQDFPFLSASGLTVNRTTQESANCTPPQRKERILLLPMDCPSHRNQREKQS